MPDHGNASDVPPQTVGVREFRANFSGFMRQVRHGASFAVTSRDEIVAIIRPPEGPPPSRRKPGALHGKIEMASDFDATSDALLAAMEGEKA